MQSEISKPSQESMEGINEGEKSDKIKKEKDVAGGEHTSEGLWERESRKM